MRLTKWGDVLPPSELGWAIRLAYTYEHGSSILDDPEYFRKVSGIGPERHAHVLSVVCRLIEGLHNSRSERRDRLAEAPDKTDQEYLEGPIFGG